jgi:secreted PhoX family phosphatase
MPMTRRFLLRTGGAGAVLAPLVALFGHEAEGAVRMGRGYGLLKPRLPLNTRDVYARRADGGLAFDYRGVPLLSLPPHFRYHVLSCTGQPMSDGGRVPGDHDGMACFPAPGGGYILLRNHELNLREAKFGSREGVVVAPELRYDSFANGGVTTLVLDAQGQLVRHFAALGGTNNNCSGGPTPWGSWLTCEESTALPADGSYTRRHGYVFEVPSDARGPVPAEPLVAMGRFAHEAAATDPRTGTVYMTEDREDGLFYRFVPNRPGELRAGGRLQALRLAGPMMTCTPRWTRPCARASRRPWTGWTSRSPIRRTTRHSAARASRAAHGARSGSRAARARISATGRCTSAAPPAARPRPARCSCTTPGPAPWAWWSNRDAVH